MTHRFGDQLVHRLRFGHIADRELTSSPGLADMVASPFQSGCRSAGDHYRRATHCKLARNRCANPGSASGYYRNLSIDAKRILHGFCGLPLGFGEMRDGSLKWGITRLVKRSSEFTTCSYGATPCEASNMK